VKIGPADLEIICLGEIIKKGKKRKKLMQAKCIALPASFPSGLNNYTAVVINHSAKTMSAQYSSCN